MIAHAHTRINFRRQLESAALSRMQSRDALVGIEWDAEVRDLHTFTCADCEQREVRSVLAA